MDMNCQLACFALCAAQSSLHLPKTSIWKPGQWIQVWIYSSPCCFVKSLGVKPLYPRALLGDPLRIRDQVVETFVTFGQSKSQAACWIEAQTKEERKKNPPGTLKTLLTPDRDPPLVPYPPHTHTLTHPEHGGSTPHNLQQIPFIFSQPDGAAGIIAEAQWVPFNLSCCLKELVSFPFAVML